jgi:hypothetical protein
MTADDALTVFQVYSLASLVRRTVRSGDRGVGYQIRHQHRQNKGLAASLKDLYNATGGSTEKLKEIIPDSLASRLL